MLAVGCGIAAAQPPAPAHCPPRSARVTEHFLSADCADCWAAHAQVPADVRPASPVNPSWRLDWIVPTDTGDGAALASAAVTDAPERLGRAGLAAPAGMQSLVVLDTIRPAPDTRMQLETGPAWSGYVGVRLTVRGRLPAGTQAWVALVEELDPGAEGSAQPRVLVRRVAGPLALHGKGSPARTEHLRAIRWPEQALAHRVRARAWIESTDGRMLGMASDTCALR